MKRITCSSVCHWCLPAVACTLSVYHCLYTLLERQYVIPSVFQYAEYAIVALFAVAVFASIFDVLRKKDMRRMVHAAPHHYKWHFVLIVVFFCFLCLSSLLLEQERAGAFRYNLGCLYDAGLSLFVLFPLGLWFGSRSDFRLLNAIIGLITIT